MATVGLIGAWIAPYKEDEAGKFTLENGKKYAKAVAAAMSNTTSEATLNADNGVDDSVKIITSATITYTPNGFSSEEEGSLLGLKSKSITIGAAEAKEGYSQAFDSEGGRVSAAFIVNTRQSGKSGAQVLFYPNVKFSPSDSEDYATKGDNISFNTPAYTGNCYTDTSGNFRYKLDFESEEKAQEYLDKAFGIASGGLSS